MPILDSTAQTATKDTSGTPTPSTDVELATFRFVAGWVLLIILLTFANRTRLGHVILYYGLALMILFVIVTEYQRIIPYLNFQTPGQLGSVS